MAKARDSKPKKSRAKGRTAADHFATAQRWIEEAREAGAARLDLSDLQKLAAIPPQLARLTALQSLDLTLTQVSDLAPLAGLIALQSLFLSGTQVSELTPLADLTALQSLYLAETPVSDLDPLAGFIALQTLYLRSTRVNDLAPLAGLTALQNLFLSGTQFSDLAPLVGLTALQLLDVGSTQVSDVAPLAGLTALQSLNLTDTQVIGLAPLTGLPALQSLYLMETQVRDLAPLTGLPALQSLDLTGTQVINLAPLADLTTLPSLDLVGTQVSDIAPLAGLTALQSLDLRGTQVSDLAPLADMREMLDAMSSNNTITRRRADGLSYAGTPVSRISPFDRLVQLDQPARTVETINEVRRRRGLPEHIPEDYERPTDLPHAPASEPDANEVEADGRELLVQKPASHSFAFRGSRIEAQAQTTPPRHPDVASDIRNEVSDKAKVASARLTDCNAPRRVISTVSRLGSSLGHSLEDVRAGILQMRFRSLEADVAAYDTEDGRKELPEDALAMLRDLASSVEDLMGCFPQLAEIEAERLAQRLKEADVPQIMEALSQIRQVAEASEAVAPSAVEALKAGEPELEHDTQIIESGASEPARIAALHARDRTVGYMLLVYRNFIAGAVKAGSEVAGLGAETWKDFRKEAPKQFSSAGVALVIAGLVNALLGPTAAVGAFALSFKPLRDRAKRVADKLASVAKKARRNAKDDREE